MKLHPPARRGSVYKRADSKFFWLAYYDLAGKRRCISSGCRDERDAKIKLDAIEKKIRAQKKAGVIDEGPMTVRRYSGRWIAKREALGIRTAVRDRQCMDHWMRSPIADLPLEDVTRDQVKDWIAKLVAERHPKKPKEPRFAPRSVLHVYAALRTMFRDAMVEHLVVASPCTLMERQKELPTKSDKNPRWRRTANFTASEAEALISDARIPEHWRVLWAMLFLTGMRIGEAIPLRWADWDTGPEPLGALRIHVHWDTRVRELVAGTKTEEQGRDVPVHPTLAKILAAWKVGGWVRYRGRTPTANDLIIPTPYKRSADIVVDGQTVRNEFLNANSTRARLAEHLELLGFSTHRRQHDTRRTFISLARAAPGCSDPVLKQVTHGIPKGTIIDDYSWFQWADRCRVVAPIKISVREGQVVPLAGCYGPATSSGGLKNA